MPHLIVGTAGHIDHGKTALVKALTGTDPDRLKEEKERGITIDLGFANLPLDADTTVGFIDVPGHERFVKNMLAGVGGIDVVMLVIAADESVMPQTREHLDICSLLHIEHGLTVLTKVDATDPELVDLAEIETVEFLKGTFLQGAPVLRVSSVTRSGIPQLIETLRGFAGRVRRRDPSQLFRLPIDRCFTMKGFGTVVSGTLIAGRIRRDEEVELLPAQRPARVRGVQVHGVPVEEALAGQRTAVNLQRVELGDVERGMVLVPPHVFRPTATFDVHLELLPSAPAPIVKRKRVRFHTGTAELMGHAVLLGQDTLRPGESTFAQVRLENPTFALPGDRFIVRQYSPMVTIGGGEILDVHPRRHRRSEAGLRERLERFRGSGLRERVAWLVEDAGLKTMSVEEVVGRLGVGVDRAEDELDALEQEGRIRVITESPRVAVDAAVFERAARDILEEVRHFHEAEPLSKGPGREDLKGRVLRDAPAALFRAAVDALVHARRLQLDQDHVHVHGRRITLAGEDERVRNLLAERFRALGLQAPAPGEVIAGLGVDPANARKILQLLARDNVLVKINEDMVVHHEPLQQLIADLRALKGTTPKFGVREFKELTGLSRKFAMPLLEYLDGQRVTRRIGDERIVL